MRFKKKQRVYWNDPDNATPDSDCSGYGVITNITGDIISIDKDDGGQVEAFPHELSTPVTAELEKYGFSPDNIVNLLEAARVALADADIFDELADQMDLSDDEMVALRDKLQTFMDEESFK